VKAMVYMHVSIVNTECCKTITLCCNILSRGRNEGVSSEHPTAVAFRPPSPGIFAGQAYANSQARRHLTPNEELGLEHVSR
jgi:hypothetical protein